MNEDIEPYEPIRILVGVDGTPRSQRALSWAIGTSRRTGGWLLAVHVSEESALVAVTPGLIAVSMQGRACLVEQLHHDLALQLDGTAIEWSLEVHAGDAATTLERVAMDHQADLIVVGASSRWHLLSTATTLVKRAVRPVVVVP